MLGPRMVTRDMITASTTVETVATAVMAHTMDTVAMTDIGDTISAMSTMGTADTEATITDMMVMPTKVAMAGKMAAAVFGKAESLKSRLQADQIPTASTANHGFGGRISIVPVGLTPVNCALQTVARSETTTLSPVAMHNRCQRRVKGCLRDDVGGTSAVPQIAADFGASRKSAEVGQERL